MNHVRTNTIKDFKIRSVDGATVVEGYAALYEVPSQPLWELGNKREIIQRGAFKRAVEEHDDVRLLINHDPNLVIARTKANTLTLTEDEIGLFFSAELATRTYESDLVISMQRGDINQNSFGFEIDEQAWEVRNGEEISVVKALHLSDVSIVTYPAYVETFSQVRALSDALAKTNRTELDNQLLRDFALKIQKHINTNDGEPSHTISRAAVDSLARRNRELELLEQE